MLLHHHPTMDTLIGGNMRQRMLGRRNGAVAVALALSALAGTGVALAANQVKGASYRGEVAQKGVTVSFKVSSTGKQVTALSISNTPIYCQGGGRPIPVRFASAPISAGGTFTSTGRYVIAEGPLKGQLGTKLKISGKFLKGGREQGVLTTTWVKTPSCSGKSSYGTSKA
jgi:hypothetical protein